MFVLYSKDKGTSLNNQDKKTSTERVQRKNKRKVHEEKVPMMSLMFLIDLFLPVALWPGGRLSL